MSVATSLHPAVVAARQRLTDERSKLRQQHEAGSPGQQVCVHWTNVVDSVLQDLFKAALEDPSAGKIDGNWVLVAHGGFGRRDLAPYSDVDLMLLTHREPTEKLKALARRLTQMIVDSGLSLGFSMRPLRDALKKSWADSIVFTSLIESRHLLGNEELVDRLLRSLRRGARWRGHRLILAIAKARLVERQKYGETVYLLQPNIKRSRGGLRDIQLVRWIGFVRYGEADAEQLVQLGVLSEEDFKSLRKGYQYLLRLRNQMHFDAGQAVDSLDRGKQVRLAQWSGTEAEEGVLPVEQFMREYFEKTSEVRYSSAHFVDTAKERSWIIQSFGAVIGWPITKDFRLGLRHVWATRRGTHRLQNDPAAVLELMSIANRFDRRIEHSTWRAIRSSMLKRAPEPLEDEVIARFLSLLQHSARLGELLRRLHELRVLEQIIPAVKHARCLMQFNDYHKYTVDAHCIRSVECATEFARNDGVVGSVYRSIRNKMLVHLSLLLHDLGKGYTEDHSEVGKRIAEKTAVILKLSESDREMLSYLVHQHLLMAHSAFRLDLSQTDTIVHFAAQVGSVDALQKLFVLTCSDLAAVGPGVLNDWKLGLITQLYQRTDSQFRDEKPDEWTRRELSVRREAVRKLIPQRIDEQKWRQQVLGIPAAYLLRYSPSALVHDLQRFQELTSEGPAIAWGTYNAAMNAIEYTVGTIQTDPPIGIFHRITGALSSQGLQILAAEIHTLPDNIVWDRFVVEDPDFEGQPPESRINEVCRQIVLALDPQNLQPPTFRRVWKSSNALVLPMRNQPTQVRFDNDTSEEFTIISVFAYDRRGLLYSIARVMFEQRLSLHVAKISTHLDQVVDVFYVSDFDGHKVVEPTQLYTLRQQLLRAIEPE